MPSSAPENLGGTIAGEFDHHLTPLGGGFEMDSVSFVVDTTAPAADVKNALNDGGLSSG